MVFSKLYTSPCYRTSQSKGSTRRRLFTTLVKHIVISVYLYSVCYLISYTILFMKLYLFEILLYITFLTTKFSKSMIFTRGSGTSKKCQINLIPEHFTFWFSLKSIAGVRASWWAHSVVPHHCP